MLVPVCLCNNLVLHRLDYSCQESRKKAKKTKSEITEKKLKKLPYWTKQLSFKINVYFTIKENK